MEDIEFEIQRVRMSTLLISQVIKWTRPNFNKKNVTMVLVLNPLPPYFIIVIPGLEDSNELLYM